MSEVDFENALKEEFSERGLIDPMEREREEPTPLEIDEATAEGEDVSVDVDVSVREGRPRNPDGTFAKVESEPDEHERFIQERFAGDPAKLAQSYQELERKLGDQGNQLGTEVQRLREELASFRSQAAPQVQAPLTQQSVEMFDEQVQASPQDAAIWALQNDQGPLYERALDYWYDTDPKGASRFERNLEHTQMRHEIRAELAPVVAPAHAQATYARFNEAWTRVEQNYPDLKEFGEGILKVAEANPRLLRGLQSGDVGDVETVIENLYLRLQRDQGGAAQRAAADAASQQAEHARAAKLGARVTSGSSSHASAEGKTALDRFKDGILEASKGL